MPIARYADWGVSTNEVIRWYDLEHRHKVMPAHKSTTDACGVCFLIHSEGQTECE